MPHRLPRATTALALALLTLIPLVALGVAAVYAGLADLRPIMLGTAAILGLVLFGGIFLLHRLGRRQRANEAELRVSRQRLQSAFDDALAGMAVVDRTTLRFLRVNARMSELLGRTEAELIGSDCGAFRPQDDLEPGHEAVTRDTEGTVVSVRTRKRLARTDGRDVVVDVSAALAPGSEPGTQHYVVQLLDITAAHAAHQQRGTTARELSAANARLEQ